MVLKARQSGLVDGKYVFIFYFQLHGDPPVGKYTWRRDDDFDTVSFGNCMEENI
jgi:hypothetical protein